MKPADFFLSSRQFLGWFVPGVLLAAASLWLFGYPPTVWLEQASLAMLAIFLVGSYLIGYITGPLAFTLLANSSRWVETLQKQSSDTQKLREAVRLVIDQDPQLTAVKNLELNDHWLAQFCKSFAAKDSEFFQKQFQEIEDEVNFASGIAISSIVAAFVGFYKSLFSNVLVTNNMGANYALLGLLLLIGIYSVGRFFYERTAEEESWYRAFLAVHTATEIYTPS